MIKAHLQRSRILIIIIWERPQHGPPKTSDPPVTFRTRPLLLPGLLGSVPAHSLSDTDLWSSAQILNRFQVGSSVADITPPPGSGRKLCVIGSCAKLLEVVFRLVGVCRQRCCRCNLGVWEQVIYDLRVCLWNYPPIASFPHSRVQVNEPELIRANVSR